MPTPTTGRKRAWRLAAIPLVGVVLGMLVGGVLGRLAMFLLIHVDPGPRGMTSDDGFTMGQFTLSGSIQLVLACGQIGLIGGIIYLLIRWLLFGPPWFRILSVTLASGIGLGSQLVHTDGVDFNFLDPVWLPIALFVLIPALYGGLLTYISERWVLGGWAPARPGAVAWVLRGAALVFGVWLSAQLVQKTVELV